MPEMDALNYPYIRVRDVEWLKRTLLLFPHVKRMTPGDSAPLDDPEVAAFQWHYGERGPLLGSANLWSPHVEDAQRQLVADLQALFRGPGGEVLLSRFRARNPREWDLGEAAKYPTVWERRFTETGSFQIHAYKMYPDLVEYLKAMRLAWAPAANLADGPLYLEMNPRLGEAIMATLAVACAENEGLQVVTEFPKLHGRLLGTPRNAILDACVKDPRRTGRVEGQNVGEFLVYRRCDVSALTPERIAALKQERDALADFRESLEKVAAQLPTEIHDANELAARLNDEVNRLFVRWRADQKNLSRYAKRLFGEGALEDPIKATGELLKGILKGEPTAGLAGAGAGAQIAHLTGGKLLVQISGGVALGFAVAFCVRAVKTWDQMNVAARTSPYRYLTALQEHGVSFTMTA